ncbi:gamma-tubulin complex component 3 [Cornus florida]|uniref:gamma-tubulin complex component 3 n=1 Tax=Cornus florida TaxID=4283 RepID=UPI002897C1FB|nr:gamma-tubulin complex component 3 [Cornus florida]XP_059646424.1 gamma-tubulin complex component 3 [Cornus florida]XP_059646425.1 gamma-tubulin complex component 3 [Cornus florida]XP_059646426.1 gamma-tubulin complex component 3 [Cornus florida]XP_059646427.1 gamma-tubulin complex component 3 [Cornus florida]
MEDEHKVLDLVKELVHRLLTTQSDPDLQKPSSTSNPNTGTGATSIHSHKQQALKYAIRILSSRIAPSIAADEAAMAESIKRHLATQGKSSDALTFADLYSKFASKNGTGSIKNKWGVLYLLKVISEDRKNQRIRSDSRVSTGFFASTVSGGLPALFDSETNGNHRVLSDNSRVLHGREELEKSWVDGDLSDNSRVLRGQETVEKGWNGGVLMVLKDPENIRDMAYREFANLLKEENEVSEEVLVRDVLYACQGIDGNFVKFDRNNDGYVLADTIKVPRATRITVRKLCELGWLFRKVKVYITESMDRFPADEVGTVGQAFCAALQDELSEYYKLLAVLEAQSMNPIPVISEPASSGNYLSLRRLAVWFAEPLVKMRLMAVLVDSCKVLRGGAMAGAIHMHAQHGDPLVHDFMRRLLRRVCSPLFEMVRSWVLEGELGDIFAEFFVLGQPVKAESLWREGYRLHAGMLPSFISQSLAQRILRTGKSINFLRVCCEDRGWADAATEAAAAAGTTTTRGGLGYGETDALESLVTEAAKRIDKHLMDVIYKQYKFKEHCLAIKRYLLLGQGDFVQYLMDIVGPELSEPANTISSFKLAGLLESAVRSSNAQYDDPDILDRLRVKMMPHNSGDRGWDVFSLEYDARIPLNTVFTESVMSRYLRIFNFLWKLRRVEHALIGAWKTMKPNCVTSHFSSKLPHAVKLQLLLTSRRCQVLWDEMNHFITNLQYYIMFEVLEVSWSNFSNEMEVAKDLDDLLAAHEKYLHSIVEKSLLGERSQTLYKTLFVLFDLILRFRSHADRLYEGIHELQARTLDNTLSIRDKAKSLRRSNDRTSEPGSWVSEGRKAITQRGGEFLRNMEQDIDATGKEFSSLLEGFISQLPVQQHIDLKFLFFRLDFTEFYSRLCPNIQGK